MRTEPISICVYCSSSDRIDSAFLEVADELGAELARRGHPLVYGGASIGLMGRVARAVHAGGGYVVGVIPAALEAREVAYAAADELLVTPDLRSRKAMMDERSGAFIVLPGGFGTLEEVCEALTLRQLGYHDRPIVFLNSKGFWDPLLVLFEHMVEHGMAAPAEGRLYTVAGTVAEALELVGSQARNEGT